MVRLANALDWQSRFEGLAKNEKWRANVRSHFDCARHLYLGRAGFVLCAHVYDLEIVLRAKGAHRIMPQVGGDLFPAAYQSSRTKSQLGTITERHTGNDQQGMG